MQARICRLRSSASRCKRSFSNLASSSLRRRSNLSSSSFLRFSSSSFACMASSGAIKNGLVPPQRNLFLPTNDADHEPTFLAALIRLNSSSTISYTFSANMQQHAQRGAHVSELPIIRHQRRYSILNLPNAPSSCSASASSSTC